MTTASTMFALAALVIPVIVFRLARKRFTNANKETEWSHVFSSTQLAIAFIGVPFLAFSLHQQVVAQNEETEQRVHMDSITVSNEIVQNINQGLALLSSDIRQLRYVRFQVDSFSNDTFGIETTGVEAVRAFCRDFYESPDPLTMLRSDFFIDMYYAVARCETLMIWAQSEILQGHQSYSLVQNVAFMYTPKFMPAMNSFYNACIEKRVMDQFEKTEQGNSERFHLEILLDGHQKIVAAIEKYQV